MANASAIQAASVAGFATAWRDFVNGDQSNDGYHRVWGPDLYQQAMGLFTAGNLGRPCAWRNSPGPLSLLE
jgi:glucoamylase